MSLRAHKYLWRMVIPFSIWKYYYRKVVRKQVEVRRKGILTAAKQIYVNKQGNFITILYNCYM